MGVHHHKAPIVTEGLVFHVDAQNIASDNTSVVRNMVNPIQAGTPLGVNPPNNTAQISGGTYDFDGVDDYINFNDIHSFDRTDTFSVSIWFKIKNNTGFVPLIGKSSNDGSFRGWLIHSASGSMQFDLLNTASNRIRVGTTTGFDDDTWHHITATYDGTSIAAGVNIYVDNNPQSVTVHTDALSLTTLSTADLWMGNSQGGIWTLLNGEIASLSIYNKELTADEIEQNYNSQKHKFE